MYKTSRKFSKQYIGNIHFLLSAVYLKENRKKNKINNSIFINTKKHPKKIYILTDFIRTHF